jgi:hypothetical protein
MMEDNHHGQSSLDQLIYSEYISDLSLQLTNSLCNRLNEGGNPNKYRCYYVKPHGHVIVNVGKLVGIAIR